MDSEYGPPKANGMVIANLVAVGVGHKTLIGVAADPTPGQPFVLKDAVELLVLKAQAPGGHVRMQMDMIPLPPSGSPHDLQVVADWVMDLSADANVGEFYGNFTGVRGVATLPPKRIVAP